MHEEFNPKICTTNGRLVGLADLSDNDIDIESIAHALSIVNRWGGHSTEPISVAEHCYLMSWCFPDDPRLALYALLHDATEAFIVDIPTPIKRYFPEVEELELQVMNKVFQKFGLDPTYPPEVAEMDYRMKIAEAQQCMRADPIADWGLVGEPAPITVQNWDWHVARRNFLGRFYQLQEELSVTAPQVDN